MWSFSRRMVRIARGDGAMDIFSQWGAAVACSSLLYLSTWRLKVPRLISFVSSATWVETVCPPYLPARSPKAADCAIQAGDVVSVPNYNSRPATILCQDRDKSTWSAPNPLFPSSMPSTSYGSIVVNTRSAQIGTSPVKPKNWTAYLWSVSQHGSASSSEALMPSAGTHGISPQRNAGF